MLICHLYILFSNMCVHVFCPSFNWIFLLLSFESFLKKIYSKHQSFVRYMVWKYFLPVCSFSLYPLNMVFHRANILILMKSNISVFFSYELCFGVNFKEFLPCPRSGRVSLMCFFFFFSLKSLIYFELILFNVWSLGRGSSFWPMGVQLFQHRFLKRLSFLHWIGFAPLSKIN